MGSIAGTIVQENSFRIYAKNCVRGGQGSPQETSPQQGPAGTPGSSMNRRSLLSPASACARAGSSVPAASSVSGSPIPAAIRHCVFIALLALCGLSSTPLHAESAGSMFKHGEAAEARGDYDTAVDMYQKAIEKSPNDLTYKTALYRVRLNASSVHMVKGRKLLLGGDDQGALVEFLHASEIDPGNEAAEQEIARLRRKSGEVPQHGETSLPEQAGTEEQLDSMGGPVVLKPLSNEPLTMHYTEDAKVIYQAIGKAAGINVLFDPDYTSKRITVDLTNESLLDALRIVGVMSNTFWRPVTDNTIFVAQNTRQKRNDLDETAVQTFYLTNAWQQNDLTDVATAVRNILTGIKIYNVPSQNAIVIRGTPDELLLAQKLINDLDKARSEVVVDIAVLEVSKNWERTLGIAWPSSVGLALQAPNSTTNTTSTTGTTTGTTGTTDNGTTPSLYDLAHLKATDFAVTIGSATANLLLTDSNTKILQNPRIRATDAQKATFKVGERIPIATGSYQTGAATAVVSSLVNTQFQYQDVGVNVEMTPTVHYDHDVTLKIKIEVTSQSGSVTISGVTEPILSQRVVDQVIRLREGEASILGGIQDKQEMVSWNGIPGLSSIPLLRYLFGSKDHTINDDELVFLVVPHIVRTQQLDEANLRTIDTGVGSTVELRHVSAPVSAAPIPATRPSAEAHPGMGVVPGQSASAAAPAALAQLSGSADANGQTAASAVASTSAQPVMAMPPPPPPIPGQSAMPAAQPMLPPPAAQNTLPAERPQEPVNLMFSMPGTPVAAGGTFTVPVVLTGGRDVDSVPMEIQYDPAKLALVNVTSGDLLSRDNQAVGLVHRDDGPGNITINASRPPGVAGITGPGVVCVLTFQAKAAGDSAISLTSGAAVNSGQQRTPVPPTKVTVSVH
jgi:general secretion pathway protein D